MWTLNGNVNVNESTSLDVTMYNGIAKSSIYPIHVDFSYNEISTVTLACHTLQCFLKYCAVTNEVLNAIWQYCSMSSVVRSSGFRVVQPVLAGLKQLPFFC